MKRLRILVLYNGSFPIILECDYIRFYESGDIGFINSVIEGNGGATEEKIYGTHVTPFLQVFVFIYLYTAEHGEYLTLIDTKRLIKEDRKDFQALTFRIIESQNYKLAEANIVVDFG